MLALARLAVRFVKSAHIFIWADRPPRRISRFATDDVSWIAWAIDDVSAKNWTTAAALPKALATHAMLRRRGIVSRLCLGVTRDGSTVTRHAWVEIGDNTVVGVAARGFTPLAVYGGAP